MRLGLVVDAWVDEQLMFAQQFGVDAVLPQAAADVAGAQRFLAAAGAVGIGLVRLHVAGGPATPSPPAGVRLAVPVDGEARLPTASAPSGGDRRDGWWDLQLGGSGEDRRSAPADTAAAITAVAASGRVALVTVAGSRQSPGEPDEARTRRAARLRAAVTALRRAGFDGLVCPGRQAAVHADSDWGHRAQAHALGYLRALLSARDGRRPGPVTA